MAEGGGRGVGANFVDYFFDSMFSIFLLSLKIYKNSKVGKEIIRKKKTRVQ